MDINSNLILITGAGSGMGAATAIKLASLGAKTILLDQNLNNVEKVANQCEGYAYAYGCDVSKGELLGKIFKKIVETIGIPQVCINCAGVASADLLVNKKGLPMPLDKFRHVIDINLIGTFNVMRFAAAYMTQLSPQGKSKERGVIINTASIAAFEGQIGQVAYSASKAGIIGMTLPAARELARHHIRVMTIAPGLINTPLLQNLPQKVRESLLDNIPFPSRFGKPEEYADLVVHIINNSFLNGTVIRLDGGLRMGEK